MEAADERENKLLALSNDMLAGIATHQQLAREYLPRLFGDDESLKVLHLNNTSCGDIPLTALADGLTANTFLEELYLDGNDITDDGAMLIAEALVANKTLKKLTLRHNRITSRGAKVLCDTMCTNDNLAVVELEGNDGVDPSVFASVTQITTLNGHPPDLKRHLMHLKAGTAGPKIALGRSERNAAINHVASAASASATPSSPMAADGSSSAAMAAAAGGGASSSSLGVSGGGDPAALKANSAYNPKIHLDDWCIEQLAEELKTNETVSLLDLSNHCITDRGAKAIADMIKENKSLDRIVLSGNAISPVGAKLIQEALEDNNTVRYIAMYKNLCPDAALVDLEWHLALNRQPLTLKALVKRMRKNDPTLVHLSLDDHLAKRYYDDIAARIVADCLVKNTCVKSLAITHSHVTEVGARFLADLLSINNTIQFVDLSHNPIGNGGAYIAKALMTNSSIIKLSLEDTDQDDSTAMAFVEALETNRTLAELDLSNNVKISHAGDHLSRVALSNPQLRVLNLLGTSIPERTLADIEERQRVSREPGALREVLPAIFDGDPTVTSVNLCGRSTPVTLRDTSIKLLAEALEQNFSVTKLDLSHNDITLNGLAYLFEMLLENRVTLVELDLSYNPIGNAERFGQMLGNILSSHTSLRIVNISGTKFDDDGVGSLIKKLGDRHVCAIRQLDYTTDNPDISSVANFKLHMYVKLNSLLPPLKARLVDFWNAWERNDLRMDYAYTDVNFSRYAGKIYVDPDMEMGEKNYPSTDMRVAAHVSQETYNEAAILLCDALKWTKGFCKLNFAENGIDDVGLAYISKTVVASGMITHLDISGNRITDAGVFDLVANIKNTYKMVAVNIDGCTNVTKAARTELTTVLLYNKQPADVKELLIRLNKNDKGASVVDFSDAVVNHLTDYQVQLLCIVLADNDVVTTIDVSNNHVHLQGLRDLCDLIKTHPNITRLRARNTLISGGADAGEIIAGLLRESSTIREIDLSYCEIREGFEGPVIPAIHANHSLEIFNLRETLLSEKTISAITNATSLNEQGALKSLVNDLAADAAEQTEINSTGAGYNDNNIVELFTALKTNTKVKRVDLSGNYISDKAGAEVITLIGENKGIEHASLRNNKLGELSFRALGEALKVNKTLRSIDLRGNNIPLEAAEALRDQILPFNSSISCIYIADQRNGGLPAEIVDFYEHHFEINYQLEIKDVIPRLVANDPTLTSFDISHNPHHNDVGCMHLSVPLMDAKFLTVLNLSNGNITDEGVRHLARGLFMNRSVVTLDLSYNRIGDEGCFAIGDIIKVNPILKHVNIAGNPHVTDAGLQNLQRVLVFTDNVESLNIDSCRHVSDEVAQKIDYVTTLNSRHHALKALLRNNGEIIQTTIDCSNARTKGKIFDDVACKILCNALADDTFITSINLSGNDLTFESGYAIAALLNKNVTICSIDLSRNMIREGIAHVVSALARNPSVVTLNIEENGCSPVAIESLRTMLQLNREPQSVKAECLQIMKQDVTHSLARISERDYSSYADVVRQAGNDDAGHSSSGSSRHILRKMQADDESVGILSNLLLSDMIVRDIDVSWNTITDMGLVSLLDLMRRNNTLRSLKISHNFITDDGARKCCEMVKKCKNIISIDLSHNKITLAVYPHIIDALISAPNVSSFHILGSHLTKYQLDAIEFLCVANASACSDVRNGIIDAFTNNPDKSELNFDGFRSEDKWNSDSLRLVSFSLYENFTIKSISLSFNGIRDSEMDSLCSMLSHNKTLEDLCLSHNQLLDISPLTTTLTKKNYTLRSLSLRSNQLDLQAAKAITVMLKDSDSLKHLDVAQNPWGRGALSLIQAALPMNNGLESITVATSGVPPEMVEAIENAACIRRRVEEIEARANGQQQHSNGYGGSAGTQQQQSPHYASYGGARRYV